ncbi:hypothetical protein ES703_43893 [subsurface metagenome]
MNAVFAPGLGNCFEFNVGGFSVKFLVVFLNGLHLEKIEEQVLFFAEGYQFFVVELAHRPVYQLKFVRLQMRARRLSLVADYHILDAVVGQYLLCDSIDLTGSDFAQQNVLSRRSNIICFNPHISHCRHYRLSHRVGNTAFEVHFD